MAHPIVTFLSDFGLDDWFVGVVHGVIHQLAPEVRVADLTHAIPPGAVSHGAFVLEAATHDFPHGTVNLAVVDPGVGTSRRALAVRARGQTFVGPDNGLLEWALADPSAVTHALTDERYFRHPVSRTFHARDVFGPVAAHVARGVALDAFGPRVTDPVRLPVAQPARADGELVGRVRLVDHFGNLLTDLSAEALATAFPGVPESSLLVTVLSLPIRGLSHSYGDVPVGALVALIGSSGRLEIAQVGGDAAVRYGIGEGDQVRVRVGEAAPEH